MTNQNLKRLRAYQNKLHQLEELPAEYQRPTMSKENYQAWQDKFHKRSDLPKFNLLKLLIP